MELEGKIRLVMAPMSGMSQATGNAWMSQEFVMDYFWWPNQTQPSQIVMRMFGEDRIKQFDVHTNDEVRVTFHVEAHEYNGRWFNEIRVTDVKKVGASAATTAAAQQAANQPAQAPQTTQAVQTPTGQNFPPQVDANGNPIAQKDDDLPF